MIYKFFNPDNPEEVIEVSQKMNDVHEYFDSDGKQWKRVFEVPGMTMDTKISPFSQKDFLKKTANTKTYGEAWKISKEMSDARASKIGAPDPMRIQAEKKFYKPEN
jgi:hypothetical protein